jgi:hypothetical protein
MFCNLPVIRESSPSLEDNEVSCRKIRRKKSPDIYGDFLDINKVNCMEIYQKQQEEQMEKLKKNINVYLGNFDDKYEAVIIMKHMYCYSKNLSYIDWYSIITKEKLSDGLILSYIDSLDLELLLQYQVLSYEVLEILWKKFEQKNLINLVIETQELNGDIIYNHFIHGEFKYWYPLIKYNRIHNIRTIKHMIHILKSNKSMSILCHYLMDYYNKKILS